MGTLYTNITLKGPQAPDIIQELSNQGRSAFVSSSEDGLTTVYELDSDEGESSILQELAEDLSGYFGCPAFAVQTLDEETFCYWLYDDGQLLDTYSSPAPLLNSKGTCSPKASGGNPELLVQHLNLNASVEEIADTLLCPDQECGITLAVDRHLSLVELLELPLCSVGFGFCDLDSGEFPEDLDEDDVLSVNTN